MSVVEHEFEDLGELGDLGCPIVHKLALLYHALVTQGFHLRLDSTSTSEFGQAIARLTLYALAIPGFPRGNGSAVIPELLDRCVEIFGITHDFLHGMLGPNIDKIITPQLMNLISTRIIHVAHASEAYEILILASWLYVLGNVSADSSVLLCGLLDRRSVLFLVPLLHRVGKSFYGRKDTTTFLDQLPLWEVIVRFIWCSCKVGGSKTIIAVIDAGILPILWKFSRNVHDVRVNASVTTDTRFYTLLEVFGAFTVFRSVQKCLQKHLRKSPLFDINPDDESSEPPVHPIWSKLKRKLLYRIEIRVLLEHYEVYCSNVDASCATEAPAKLFQCGGCHLAFYCSRSCQKTHWNRDHREICRAVPDEAKHCLYQFPDERDRRLMGEIGKAESWYMRNELLSKDGVQELAVTTLDSMPVFQLDFTCGPDVVQRPQLTLGEAKRIIPGEDRHLDSLVHDYLADRNSGYNVLGPIVLSFFPAPAGEQAVKYILTPPPFPAPGSDRT
ncbi:hypothetical protein D9757_010250 [Collybiopsis confluens]|uniref:MYND-type domain-containing protein n=1 Tax=Collybiopsis confluens TaxID=2823264 RepID=A0A8H5M418_9AGAR|nr:hypothetical protein D9757_010250 [Collybiopsis confluens]